MSENPIAGNPFFQRKIAGVPMLYLLAGFVLILVVLAWTAKPKVTAPESVDGADSTDNYAPNIQRESVIPPVPVGTVNSIESGETLTGNSSISTNDEWLSRAVMFLADKGYSPGTAQLALSTYLDGGELSFDEGKIRDLAIREFGVPPYPVNVGSTRPDIARKQGPIPRNHTVKNSNDDTAFELARLYYGRTDATAIKAITDANNGATTWQVGDTPRIPALPIPTPAAVAKPVVKPVSKPAVPAKPAPKPARYHTVVKGDTLSGIAKRYYGNASLWPKIATANKISNPNLIYPGQKFLIP